MGSSASRVSDDGLGMDEEEAKTLQQRLLTFDNSARSIGLRNLRGGCI